MQIKETKYSAVRSDGSVYEVRMKSIQGLVLREPVLIRRKAVGAVKTSASCSSENTLTR